MRRLISISVLGFAMLVAGCSQTGETGDSGQSGESNGGASGSGSETDAGTTITTGEGSYTRVEPETLRRIVDERDPLVINTHIPYEGELPATDRFIPYDRIGESPKLPNDKSAAIVLYCKGGPMSEQAAETLVDQGYTGVLDLEGGMDAWESAGFTLERTADG